MLMSETDKSGIILSVPFSGSVSKMARGKGIPQTVFEIVEGGHH